MCGEFECKLPTSGDADDVFDPVPWSTPGAIAGSNCMAYALNDFSPVARPKATPGALAAARGNRRFVKELDSLSCPSLTRRLLSDNPGLIYKGKTNLPCKKGFNKVFMLATKKGRGRQDFHFLRLFNDVKYPIQPGDTISSVAHKFQVPLSKVSKLNDQFMFIKDAKVLSHKRGTFSGALLTDACGRIMFDPRLACRNYGDLQYRLICGSFCAARRGVKTA